MFSDTRPATVAACVTAALCAYAAPAFAQQTRSTAHIVTKATSAHLWLHVPSRVVADLQPGMKVDFIDREGDWLWVVVPPDANGTRRAGWVRADAVGTVVINAAAANPSEAAPNAGPGAAPEPVANGDDKVTISVADTHVDAASSSAGAATATTFDDVHFDRNRSALRAEDTDILQKMVAALKADPSLVVDIEGHTCDLGTAAYNRTLGLRRANAVKDYLVAAGIDEGRLHTVTKGKANPLYDNSQEDTRKLNRRVALVPEPRR